MKVGLGREGCEMNNTLLFLAVFIFMITSCAPSPIAIQTAIAGTVIAYTPIPTQTSYPTFTPYPTLTLDPTYTPYPTAINRQTVTRVVVQTLIPILSDEDCTH